MSEMLRIDNYTPEQEAVRRRVRQEVVRERRYFQARLDAIMKPLVEIEMRHNPTYVFVPDADA